MKSNDGPRRMIRWGALALCAAALAGCGPRDPQKGTGASDARVVAVEAVPAQLKELSVIRTFSGSLEGENQASIVARLGERVTGIPVHVGESVRAGEAVVLLDKNGASSQYYQAQANFVNVGKNLERMKSLYAEGAIALQALDGAQTAYDVAKSDFEAARSSVELTTPIDGIVTAVNVRLGDLAVPGEQLATVARIDRMQLVFSIDEIDATSFRVGQTVHVYSDTRPDAKVPGEIVQLSRSADVKSRSFEVKALFDNTRDRWFRPGMYCRVEVPVSSGSGTLAVPSAAVQSDGAKDWVFVIRGGRAFRTAVRPGLTNGELTAVTGGLATGDSVATVGASTLADSALVTVVKR